jgi:hypothetical protein
MSLFVASATSRRTTSRVPIVLESPSPICVANFLYHRGVVSYPLAALHEIAIRRLSSVTVYVVGGIPTTKEKTRGWCP